jgi:hypothetical protein
MRALNQPVADRMRLGPVLLLALVLASGARADDSDPAARVARIALVRGQVSIEPAGLDDWAAADVNRPLTTGDRLWSDADSRVELSIGSAVIRLASATGFSFLNLDDHTAQMQVTAGTVSVHVRNMDQNDTLEVDTPNIAVSLLGPGDYRVEVNDAGDSSVVKVSGGTAEVSGGGQDYPVHPQQQMTFSGTAVVSAVAASLGAPDAFDAWTFERDRRTRVAQTTSYVSPDVVGAEDLDQNGTWQSTPDEGYVWAPNSLPVGWVPYHDGHWIWISPWGWTWVDDAAWGFAPFHYGRWATFGGRWCWLPGPPRIRPVYAPALVAWVGGAPLRASAAFGGGAGVAWFALGPREVYVPAYPVSSSYVRNINVSNTRVNNAYITNVYNHNVRDVRYVNLNAPGAITAVSQTTFTTAQPAGRNAVRLPSNELSAATFSTSTPPITPAKQSVLGASATGAAVRRPPLLVQNRRVLVKTTPPPAPVPFAAEQVAIHANGGRPLARSELTALAVYAPVARVRAVAPAAGAQLQSGMMRASRANPATPPIKAAERPPALTHRETASVVSSQSIARPTSVPQGEAHELTHRDRPPGAVGQPGIEDRSRANDLPQPAEVRGSVGQDSTRRVDRPASQTSPAPVLAPKPIASATPVEVVQPAAMQPQAKPVAHAEKPVHPAARVSN